MIRKLLIAAMAIALCFGAFTLSSGRAEAQTRCTTYNCIDYPAGGFTPRATPTPRPTPQPTSSAVVSADTVDATSGGAGNASIAFTGSESRVLGYVGAGLIGFGAIALAAARRKDDTNLD